MRVEFFASTKDREQDLAAAFLAGAKADGAEVDQRCLGDCDEIRADAVAMVGVKSRDLFQRVVESGAVPIMLDKGYSRHRKPGGRVWEYWRLSVGAHHPTSTSLMRHKMPGDRLEQLGLEVEPWRLSGNHILIAGSSAKYHEFCGLPEPNEYYSCVVAAIRERTDRPIIYRPKPSFRDALPIAGTQFSTGNESVKDALVDAHALVTHGSNACFEAALVGVPSIVLGDAVAAPISSCTLDELEDPRRAKREQWLANLAYHQWTEEEMATGEAWQHIRGWINDFRA